MNHTKYSALDMLVGVLLAGTLGLAHATVTPVTGTSANATTIQPGNGSTQCSTYNAPVLQVGTSYPKTSGTLSSKDGTQAIPYTFTGTTLSFKGAKLPVNYAVLTTANAQTAQVIYPVGGVNADSNISLAIAGQTQSISAFSLCYGLPFVSQSTIPTCESLASLNGTEISCPADGSRRLIVSSSVDQRGFGTDQGPVACVCNNGGPLLECDPKAIAGAANACPEPPATATPPQVNGLIQLSNDPYACTTLGGTLKCYAYTVPK